MTFENWWNNHAKTGDDGFVEAEEIWNAAQQADREKYQELIAAAEAVLGCYVYEYDEMDAFEEFERLRIALEKMKNDDR